MQVKNKSLKISLIFLTLSVSSCRYTPEKVTPIFPDFSKRTVNTFRVKSPKPLEFELAEQAVPFSEVEKRQINKDLEPLVCFPISQVQEMRRAWENDSKNKASTRNVQVHNTVPAHTRTKNHAGDWETRMLNDPYAGEPDPSYSQAW